MLKCRRCLRPTQCTEPSGLLRQRELQTQGLGAAGVGWGVGEGLPAPVSSSHLSRWWRCPGKHPIPSRRLLFLTVTCSKQVRTEDLEARTVLLFLFADKSQSYIAGNLIWSVRSTDICIMYPYLLPLWFLCYLIPWNVSLFIHKMGIINSHLSDSLPRLNKIKWAHQPAHSHHAANLGSFLSPTSFRALFPGWTHQNYTQHFPL